MPKKLVFILIYSLSITGIFAQKNPLGVEIELQQQIAKLDAYMQDNNPAIVTLLTPDVSFGHSNAWIQNHNDFKKDIDSKKVTYKSIKQSQLNEYKRYKNSRSIRRTITVIGTYNMSSFQMDLSVLEIWVRHKKRWKLWSRQSTELKP